MYKRKARILFLDTDNSCFSQMAEGYANTLAKHIIEARSAGIIAQEKNPGAEAIMLEDGIDISSQESKQITPEVIQWADLLVMVSKSAVEYCPEIPSYVQIKHWSLPDPNKVAISETEFRVARDEIKRRVCSMIGGMKMMGNQ